MNGIKLEKKEKNHRVEIPIKVQICIQFYKCVHLGLFAIILTVFQYEYIKILAVPDDLPHARMLYFKNNDSKNDITMNFY